jgi:hypothetical protein
MNIPEFSELEGEVDVLASVQENGLSLRFDTEQKRWIVGEGQTETVMHKAADRSVYEFLRQNGRESVIKTDDLED